MALPLLLSVPHAGLRVPDEAAPHCILTERQIAHDGDEGAAAIYDLRTLVAEFATTDIARAIVDLNRAEDDRRADGVVKTYTCWNEPVYSRPLDDSLIEALLARYYRPYHAGLAKLAGSGVILGIDCHTMAAKGPPIGPDPGAERPWICLSHGDGTCSAAWMDSLADCFAAAFEHDVSINHPFRGGYITRAHAAEMPWVQLELSRGDFLSNAEKRVRIERALRAWCTSHAR